MYNTMTITDIALKDINVVRIKSWILIPRKKNFFLLSFPIWMSWWMSTKIQADQIIMLYTLNLHSAVHQLYLNKSRKKDFGKNVSAKAYFLSINNSNTHMSLCTNQVLTHLELIFQWRRFFFSPTFWMGRLSLQFSSAAQSCPTLCDPMNRSRPGLPVHHQLPESTQSQVHWVGDATQPPPPLSSPSPPALNLSQCQVSSNESALHIRWPSLRVVQKVMNIAQLESGRASSWICSQWTHYSTAQITSCQERALTPGQGSWLLSSQWSPNIRYKETKLEIQARDTQVLSNQARDTQAPAYQFCFWQFFQDLLLLSTWELC